MAFWQSKLAVSSLALRVLFAWQCFLCSFLLYHVVQGSSPCISLLFSLFVILECRCAAKKLKDQVGDIQINERHEWIWHNKTWRLRGRPILCYWGVLITLTINQHRTRFWLMQDKMSQSEWRHLQRYLYWHYPSHRRRLSRDNDKKNSG